MASPMSPLIFSLPDMKSIWPFCLPDSMSSQSWAEICSVRLGLVPAPSFTVQVPSLMVAFQVPPPSPLTSYWMTALVPAARSALKRDDICSNVSFTVGMAIPPLPRRGPPAHDDDPSLELGHRGPASEREQVHAPGDRQDGSRDVSGALGAQEGDGAGHVLRLSLALHGHALDHPLVERTQARVGSNDPGSDGVAGDVVSRALQGHRLGEADHSELGGGIGRLAE